MATGPSATAAPPVEVVLSEVVTSLAMLAYAYLEPPAPSEGAEASVDLASADLASAEIAIDVAGRAFERIAPRLGQDERSALARLLTELRLNYVKKRGL
jgi:hypothetical protein